MKNKNLYFLMPFMFCLLSLSMTGQQNVGINTNAPVRDLEVSGAGNVYARIRTSSNLGNEASLELLVGGALFSTRDYKLSNDAGNFRLLTSDDNFESNQDEIWRINAEGRFGIGTMSPGATLHITGGEEASNTTDGMLILGAKSAVNMVFDNNEIVARNNGNSSPITLQSHGGLTTIGQGGGDVYMGVGGGDLGIGTSSPGARLSIDDNEFQLALRNSGNAGNDWYIGATNSSWVAGSNQLVFSPTSSSSSSVLRLRDVTDNNGDIAPVMIHSSASQVMLLDGNEIDTKFGPLHINYNSGQDTYINPSGGRTGIGTSAPASTLHVAASSPEQVLTLQRGTSIWTINPVNPVGMLSFLKNGAPIALVNAGSGQWESLSDRRFKTDILPLTATRERLGLLRPVTYTYRHDRDATQQIGLIAQEVAPEFPELVSETDGRYALSYSKLSVLILKALQEQQEEITLLENELNTLIRGN